MTFWRRKEPPARQSAWDRKAFLKLLAKRFYPELRKEGFKGSGKTLRRIDEPLVHVVNVQGSHGADGFFINLGANLTFLYPLIAEKTLESNCAFRDRLEPPVQFQNRLWPYAASEPDANIVIDEVIRAWSESGHAFFDAYASYPESFERLIRETDFGEMHPNHVFTHAKIARQLGQEETAVTLVHNALPAVGAAATGLLSNMQAFLAERD